jgi:hypothetical protein
VFKGEHSQPKAVGYNESMEKGGNVTDLSPVVPAQAGIQNIEGGGVCRTAHNSGFPPARE